MRHAAVAVLLMLLLAPLYAQQPNSSAVPSVTEDLSKGWSFDFSIAPALPAFVFELLPSVQPPDQFGNAQSTIREIRVYRKGSGQLLQHLTGCNLSEMEPPGTGAEFFSKLDINFDGYADIFLETWHGATGNFGGCIWLYNPTSGQFEFSEDFSKLQNFWLDPKQKIIFTFATGGMLGLVHNAAQFAVEDNRPVLVWSEVQDWDSAKDRLHCIVKERRDTGILVVRDLWSDREDKSPPCSAGAFFNSHPRQ